MTGGAERARAYDDLICAVLRGEGVAWPATEAEVDVEEFLARADHHGILPLLDDRLRDPAAAGAWPESIRTRCRAEALSGAAWELAQRGETIRLLAAFREVQLKPLILKGAALACSLYAHPGLRPRSDLDLIVAEADHGRAEEVLRHLGYARQGVPMGPHISRQSTWSVAIRHGSSVDVDLHWRSSNSPALARLMGYEEMQARAVPVPSLGPAAFAPCPVHALLFACIHRAGHEHAPMYVDGVAVPAKDRLIWLYDIHLLASTMPGAELEEAASIASNRRMTAFVQEALELCELRFALRLPASVKAVLAHGRRREPAPITHGGRLRGMAGDFLAICGAAERLLWLRELAFPSAQYMHAKYPTSSAWLPVLYARRAVDGFRKL